MGSYFLLGYLKSDCFHDASLLEGIAETECSKWTELPEYIPVYTKNSLAIEDALLNLIIYITATYNSN